MRGAIFLIAILAGARASAQQSPTPCFATASSLTPGSWRAPVVAAMTPPTPGLRLVREIPLPGPANRFDYQSVDPASGRIYMNHMNAGSTIVFDADNGKVIAEIMGLPRATGVWAVPAHHQIYVSAPGAHEVAIIDDRSLKVVARVGGVRFPDGIAYAPEADKVFVSDESGGADVVIDPKTGKKRSAIDLRGDAGNTHYDSVSHCILVAVQTRNQLVAIDPFSERIVRRYELPGSDHPHGFALDEPGRLAFVTSESSGLLQVVDLRTMKILQALKLPDDPDVLAWDPSWRRLYVASESAVLSAYWLDGQTLRPIGEVRLPHAHTVSVDPRTHLVYLPLENINGGPVLWIYEPTR
jgi:DNA-binding beta-propeller fold protein YncE